MEFDLIPGQEKAMGFLQRALEKGRLAQAYLFLGPSGVGKTSVAKAFALKAMAEDCKACGNCHMCKAILEERHPDFLVIRPLPKEIGIDQIRELRREILNRPFEAKVRFVLVEYAHTMTLEAANAFLKTLEEPSQGNIFVLESHNKRLLPPTIASRCQKILFKPISQEEISRFLVGKRGVNPETAQAYAAISRGSIKKALDLLERKVMDERAALYYRHTEMLRKNLGEAAYGGYRLVQELLEKNEDLSEYLLLLLTWYRDLIATKLGLREDMLINYDFTTTLKELSAGLDLEALTDAYLEVEKARQDILKEANPNLVFGELLLTCKEKLSLQDG